MKLKKLYFYFFLLIITSRMFAQNIVVIPYDEKEKSTFTWGSTLVKYNIQKNSTERVYESTELKFWDNKIKISPRGNLIGTIATINRNFLKEKSSDYQRFSFLVLDSIGKLIIRLDDAVLFDWAPEGNRAVYVTGIRYSDKDLPSTDHIWMIDLRNMEKIDLGSTDAVDIVWTEFDGKIYLDESRGIMRIDSTTHKKELTEFKGLNFSTDGRYYYTVGMLPNEFKIFERETNKDITPSGLVKSILTSNLDWNFSRWLPQQNKIIIGDKMYDKKIINVATGSIEKTITGNMIGYNKITSEIIVLKVKKLFKDLPESKVEKIKIE